MRIVTRCVQPMWLLVLVSVGVAAAWSQALVTFVDPDLEAVVREAIGRPQGPIYSQYLRNGALTTLDASSSSISDLSGLQYAVELVDLDLSGNSIINLSRLSSLTALEHLNLEGNLVSNVQDLQSLKSLVELNLRDNNIQSLESLLPNTGLGDGDTLDVRDNPLSQRTLCGVLTTFANRGATVLADGPCTGTATDPGDVDQSPDLFGTLLVLNPNTQEQEPATCGAVEVYQGNNLVSVAMADSRGYFYVEGLELGETYSLIFHAKGYEDVSVDDLMFENEGQEVVPGVFDTVSDPVISGVIRLTVFDDDAPRPPIAGALVRVFQFRTEVARTITCADGSFEFDNDTIPFPGAAELRFSADDFVPEPLTVLLPALDLEIGLEKLVFPNSVIGVVVNKRTGAPIEGAEVIVQPTWGLVSYSRTSGPDGSYIVDNVEDGEYSAHAVADGFDAATEFGFVEQDVLQLDLELPREGSTTGPGCHAATRSNSSWAGDVLLCAFLVVGVLGWRRRASMR